MHYYDISWEVLPLGFVTFALLLRCLILFADFDLPHWHGIDQSEPLG